MKTIYMEVTLSYLIRSGKMTEKDVTVLMKNGEAKSTLAKSTNYIVIKEPSND